MLRADVIRQIEPVEDLSLRTRCEKIMKRDGELSYHVKGDGIHFSDGDGNLQDSDHTLFAREDDDAKDVAVKISCAPLKVGLSADTSAEWMVGNKSDGKDGKLVRSSPRAIEFYNTSTRQFAPLFRIQASKLAIEKSESGGSAARYADAFEDVDLLYTSEFGEFKQSFVFKAFRRAIPKGWREEDTEVAFLTEIDYTNAELTLGSDIRPWGGGTTEKINEMHFRESGVLKFYWAAAYATRETFKGDPDPMIDYLTGKEVFAELRPKTICEITKRYLQRDDKYYLLETVPWSFLATADYKKAPVVVDYTTKSGTETENQSWAANSTYYLSATYTLSIYNLIIGEGTAVKIIEGANKNIVFNNSGYLTVNGTTANPVIFCSKNDDTAGEAIAGSTGSPNPNGWGGIQFTRAVAATDTISNLTIKHAGNITGVSVISLTGSGASIINITNVIFTHCYATSMVLIYHASAASTLTVNGWFSWENGTNIYGLYMDVTINTTTILKNLYLLDMYQFLYCWVPPNIITINNAVIHGVGGLWYGVRQSSTTADITIYNARITNIGTGIKGTTSPSVKIYDSIIDNNINGLMGDGTVSDYCCVTQNVSFSYLGATPGAHSIITNPRFVNCNCVAGLLKMNGVAVPRISWLLNQALSPCVGTGSRTLSAAGLSGKTTNPNGTAPADGSTVSMGPHFDAFSLPDFPDAANVVPPDTTNGVLGTFDLAAYEAGRNDEDSLTNAKLLSGTTIKIKNTTYTGSASSEAHTANQVLKSAGGNWNDDNTSAGNIRAVAFGLSQTGDLSNLVASDAAYVTLENSRNDANGTVAADIATGKSVKIRSTTISGASDKLYSATEEAARNIDPTEPKVVDGTLYKILGVDKEGSLPGTVLPTKPTIAYSFNDTTGVLTITVSGGNADSVNTLKYKTINATAWTSDSPTLTGNGIMTLTAGSEINANEFYQVMVDAAKGSGILSSDLLTIWTGINASKHEAIMTYVVALIHALAWNGWVSAQVSYAWSRERASSLYPRIVVFPGQENDDCPDRTNMEFETIYPVFIRLEDRFHGKTDQMTDLLSKREQIKALFKQANVLSAVEGVFNVDIIPRAVIYDADEAASFIGTEILLKVHVNETRS